MALLKVGKHRELGWCSPLYKSWPSGRLIRKASSVIGADQDSVASVADRRTLSKLLSITDNSNHPLHELVEGQRSLFSGRLLSLNCSTDRLRKSFLPRAIRLYNISLGRGGRGAVERGE